MVRRAYELSPAQVRGVASKKTKLSTAAGPHLARGRWENLIRSRSGTPSDEDELMADTESTSTFRESIAIHDPNSPSSAIFSSTSDFSPSAFSNLSVAQGPQYPMPHVQPQIDNMKRQESQEWTPMSVDEELQGDPSMVASWLSPGQPQISYPYRLNDFQRTSATATVLSPQTMVISPPLHAVTALGQRRFSANGLRPLAQRPPNYRAETEPQDVLEQAALGNRGKKRGKKTAYRTQEERDKVKAVRDRGACLRCQIMRQGCEVTEDGEACKNCKVNRRKFSIPCTREGPAVRWKYLFPALVTSRHDYRSHRCIEAAEYPGMFRLPLTHASGFTLDLNVVEDPDIPPDQLVKRTFVHVGDDPGNVTLRIGEEMSVPLIPVISTSFRDVAEWIAEQIANIKTELFTDLPVKMFPVEKGQDWPRFAFHLFQQFHEEVYQSPRIHRVFKTVLVRHLMSRRFYVPFDRMWEVNAKLSARYQEKDIDLQMRRDEELCMVPKFINKYIKSALMHLLRDSFKHNFAELEDLFKLHEKNPGSEITDLDRDEALCYVAMVLILVAITQSKIMQVAMSRDREASHKCPFGVQTSDVYKAKEIIIAIEAEVIDHILGLWTYKFIKSNRKGQLQKDQIVAAHKAQRFDLFGAFQRSKLDHAATLSTYTDLTLDLEEPNLDRFLVNNPTRVLLRFAQTLQPPKGRRGQPQ